MKLLLLVLGALLIAVPAHAVTFNDGGTHTIDADNSYPLDPVVVEDSPTGQPTTLIINEGGDIGSISGDGLTANGSSVVTMNGGDVSGSTAVNDSSTFSLNGGSANGSIRLTGTSLIAIDGGNAGPVTVCDASRYQQTGGQVASVSDYPYISGCDRQPIPDRYTISGGTISGLFHPNAGGVHMTGGHVQQMKIFYTSEYTSYGDLCYPISITGGTVGSFSNSSGSNCQDVTFSGTAHVYFVDHRLTTRILASATVTGCGYGNGLMILEGGTFSGSCTLHGTLRVYSGTLAGDVSATTNSRFEVLSGPVFGASVVELRSNSSAAILGGPFTTHSANLFDTAFLEIVGTDFNYPLGLISDGAGALGTLTGTLADGSAISIDFQKTSTASVLLRAPATPTNSDLEVFFVSPPTTVDTYGSVNLSFSVTNNGPDPADNVEVTFDAPATAINPTITTGTWSQSGSTFTSELGTLASGAAATFEMTYSVGADAGTLDHSVSVLSNIYDPISIDPNEIDNTATAAITIQCGTTEIYAQNPASNSWVAFPDSCAVPSGWTVSQTRPEGFLPIGYDEGEAEGYESGYAVGAASADAALAAAQSEKETALAALVSAESEKDAALAAQATAESERDAALAAQTACSSDRTAALTAQAAAESARDAALAAQESAETARDAALAAQTVAESERDVALAAQAVAESGRDAALAAQEASESERDVALAAQAVAEAERDLANASQATAESQRDSALLAQSAAEAARDAALAAQATAEAARDSAVLAQASAEADRNGALLALSAVTVQRDTALAAAASAEADRNAAAAALATALTEREAALAELLETQLELDECRTEIAPEPNAAFLGFIALATLAAVARGRRGVAGNS